MTEVDELSGGPVDRAVFDPQWVSKNIASAALAGGCSHHLVVSNTAYPAYSIMQHLSVHENSTKFRALWVSHVRAGEDVFGAMARALPAKRGWRRWWSREQAQDKVLEDVGSRHLVIVLEDVDRVFREIGEQGQTDLRRWIEESDRPATVLAVSREPSDSLRSSRWWGSFALSYC